MSDRAFILRLERSWAEREAHFATTLASLEPSWGTQVFSLADGTAVLGGKGLFVNRAFGVGLEASVSDTELDEFEQRCRQLDVVPTIEVTDVTQPLLVRQLADRGYAEVGETAAVWRSLDDLSDLPEADPLVRIDPVDAESLHVWQETAAEALEITDPDIRRASDAFALTALHADTPGLLLARSTADDRLLGCATLEAASPIAVLGGMSTLPAERRQGIQGQLLAHRVRLCRDLGCELATSTADAGSVSERNLLRFGFERSHLKRLFTLEK